MKLERVPIGTRFVLHQRFFSASESPLSWRPCHRAAAEQVKVDVVYRLATVRSCINDGAVSLRESFGACDFRSGPLQMTEEFLLWLLGVSDGGDVYSRDDKDVHGGLRLDIGEGVAVLILVDSFGRNGSVNDLAKDAVHDEESTGFGFGSRGPNSRPAKAFSATAGSISTLLFFRIFSRLKEAVDGLCNFTIESSHRGERHFDKAVLS
jgi:hypothetical protein